MSERVTLELSDELARRARTVAIQTDRSLEEVLVAGIDRALTESATTTTCGVPEQPAVTPVWLRRSLEKLHGLSKLRPDWDSHGGLPLQPEVRRFAERLLGWVTEELPLPAVVLRSGGTVQFEWQVDGRELQIEDRDGALDLRWLPYSVPVGCWLIVSTLPGRCFDEVRCRGWTPFEVRPLDIEDRKQLSVCYLNQYAKTLSPEQLQHLVTARQTANPLFLRALLEELRIHGSFETLGERLDYYLAATTPSEWYACILARCEADCEQDRPYLVRDALRLLWAARRGLSETELLELLGDRGRPLPHVHWSILCLNLENALLSRSGLLNFSHDYVRGAVEQRYLPRARDMSAAHRRLADYFERRQFGAVRTRDRWGMPYLVFLLLYAPLPALVTWYMIDTAREYSSEPAERALQVALMIPAATVVLLLGAVLVFVAECQTARLARRGRQAGGSPCAPWHDLRRQKRSNQSNSGLHGSHETGSEQRRHP